MDLLAAMRTFVRVVDARSLSGAARGLKVTPAAVSRQLAALEADLGATLLLRTTRRLALTEEGRRFYEHAERTVNDADEARASVRADRITGRTAVSVPTILGVSGLDTALADLLAANPNLQLDLRLEDQPADLLADGIDIAVRAGLVPPDSTTLVASPLVTGDRVIVCSPSYLRRRGEPKQPADLAAHDAIVHLHAGPDVGIWRLHAADPAQPPVAVAVAGPLRSTSLHVLRDAAIHGAGLALLPRFVVAADLAHRRLRALALGGWQPRPQQIYALLRIESRNRARVRVVLEHIRRHLASLVEPA